MIYGGLRVSKTITFNQSPIEEILWRFGGDWRGISFLDICYWCQLASMALRSSIRAGWDRFMFLYFGVEIEGRISFWYDYFICF